MLHAWPKLDWYPANRSTFRSLKSDSNRLGNALSVACVGMSIGFMAWPVAATRA